MNDYNNNMQPKQYPLSKQRTSIKLSYSKSSKTYAKPYKGHGGQTLVLFYYSI